MTDQVVTSSTNPGPAVNTSSTLNTTQKSSDGYRMGQSATDKIAFYNATPIVQPTSQGNALALLGLVASDVNAATAAGATLTVTAALHSGKTILLDTAAGSVVTLPAATGSGNKYRFLVSVIATSNSHVVKVANATDFFIGGVSVLSDNSAAMLGFFAVNSGTVATNSDTITLNRSTTGSTIKGEYFEIEDVATATFAIKGLIQATGTEATPFSAGV